MTRRTRLQRRWHPKRFRMRGVTLRLPRMTPEEAVLLADVLEELVGAIWKTYGDAMADHLAAIDPEGMPEQEPPGDTIPNEEEDP
jgi:hypothetical protein